MVTAIRRLLIIACSKRKKENNPKSELQANELYDGVIYRLIKKWKRQNPKNNMIILIISAKYGLITWNEIISPYDLRMNSSISELIKPQIQKNLVYSNLSTVKDVYIELGKDYINSIPYMSKFFPNAKITYGKGRIGERLHNLALWLNEGIRGTR